MHKSLGVLFIAILFVPGPALADTYTWTMTDVPHGTSLITLDVGITGITGVTIEVAGTGGYDMMRCESLEETTFPIVPVTLMFRLDDPAARSYIAVPMEEPFAYLGDMALDGESGADFLADGEFEMYVWDTTTEIWDPHCSVFGLHSLNSTIDSATLTFTYSGVVADLPTTWGNLKSTYR